MAETAKYVTLTADNFETEVIQSPIPVLVDFWAAWCGPCRLMNPIMDSLAEQFAGQAKIAKLNIDDFSTLATDYHIMGVPTLLFFNQGNLIARTEGVMPEPDIVAKLKALLAEA